MRIPGCRTSRNRLRKRGGCFTLAFSDPPFQKASNPLPQPSFVKPIHISDDPRLATPARPHVIKISPGVGATNNNSSNMNQQSNQCRYTPRLAQLVHTSKSHLVWAPRRVHPLLLLLLLLRPGPSLQAAPGPPSPSRPHCRCHPGLRGVLVGMCVWVCVTRAGFGSVCVCGAGMRACVTQAGLWGMCVDHMGKA